MNLYVISDKDRKHLDELIVSYRPGLVSEVEQLTVLRQKLTEGVIVLHDRLAPCIVRMYSEVRILNLPDRTMHQYVLVYPHEARASYNHLSILSPLGTALLGMKEGDLFECYTASRTERFAVISVSAPLQIRGIRRQITTT
jgi:regulator of nucleoside diphosphate kinase